MSRRLKLASAAVVAVTAVVMSATPAFAHEQRQVGAYQFTVGWLHEPTYAGIQNGVELLLKDAKGNPIDDLGSPASLKVQVISGSQTSDPLLLQASFDPDTGLGTHGEFDAAMTPTTPGDFTFHFTGAINGQLVDEKFTSSERTFDTVKAPTEIEFPLRPPAVADLANSVDRLGPRLDTAVSLGRSAKDKASTATTLGVIALAVGVVVGGLGVLMGATARRRPGG